MTQLISRKLVIFIASIALFMEALDVTIINTAIPSIAASLDINPINLKMALISYLLSLAIFIPISGWIADKYGAKRVFIFALIVFSLSSCYCGFAHHLISLVVGRFLQGIGGSLMLPVARLIMARAVSKHELVSVIGRVVMIAALGAMLGPILGGIMVHYFSWPWIFWINIPIGLVAIGVTYYGLMDPELHPVPPLDVIGFLLFGAGLALLTLGLSLFSETMVSDLCSFVMVLISVVLLLTYVWHSHYKANPIIKSSLFQARSFRISALGNLVARLGFEGAPFLIILLLQVDLAYSPMLSGLLFSASALGVIFAKAFATRWVRYLGYRRLLILNSFFMALSLWSFMWINAGASIYFIALLIFIYGFLISIQYSAMNSLAYADVAIEDYAAATSIMITIQRISQSFGVAVAAFLIRLYAPDFTAHAVITTPSTFHHAFLLMGFVTALAMGVFACLTAQDGRQLIAL